MRCSRVLLLLVAALLALALPAAASAGGPPPPPSVTVSVAHAPDVVSASTPLTRAYIASTVIIANTGRKDAKKVAVNDTPPAGATAVSATASSGTCAVGAEVKCQIGTLAAGAAATISVVFTSPSVAGTVANKVKVSFETPGDGPHGWDCPKSGSASALDQIPVTLIEGAVTTFLPGGVPGDISTSTTADETTTPSRPQVAGAIIPAQPAGETVVLQHNNAAFTCPYKEICRSGQWTEAHIVNGSGQPLQFELRWDASLVSPKQTTKNFVVFYRKTLDAPTQKISCHCDAKASNRPCLKSVTKRPDGDFSVVVVKDDNGYMR